MRSVPACFPSHCAVSPGLYTAKSVLIQWQRRHIRLRLKPVPGPDQTVAGIPVRVPDAAEPIRAREFASTSPLVTRSLLRYGSATPRWCTSETN